MSYLKDFFFRERPTESIGLFRILFSAFLLFGLILEIDHIVDFYGPHGILSLESIRDIASHNKTNLFLIYENSYDFTFALFIVYGISLILTLVGLWTRPALIIVFICMLSLHQRNLMIIGSTEVVIRFLMLFLIYSPAGDSLSIDSMRSNFHLRSPRYRSSPIWPIRLIQIYATFIHVIMGWRHLKQFHEMNFLFWSMLLLGIFVALGLWIKSLRKISILLGVIFYLLMGYLVTSPFYSGLMCIVLFVFITPEELRSVISGKIQKMINGIKNSSIKEGIKSKIIAALGGQHETTH